MMGLEPIATKRKTAPQPPPLIVLFMSTAVRFWYQIATYSNPIQFQASIVY
jgi:hypothetical protein